MYFCQQCRYKSTQVACFHNGYSEYYVCYYCNTRQHYYVIDEEAASIIQIKADNKARQMNKVHIQKNINEQNTIIALVLTKLPLPEVLLRSIHEINQTPLIATKCISQSAEVTE